MSPIPHPRLACLLAASIGLAATAHAQTVYTWKDAKGVTHYADAPPKGAGKQQVKTVKAAPVPMPTPGATPPATTTVAATASAAQAASNAAAANARCSQANLTALQGAAPVGPDADGDGKPDSTLSSDDRAKQVAAMQAAITRDCAGN